MPVRRTAQLKNNEDKKWWGNKEPEVKWIYVAKMTNNKLKEDSIFLKQKIFKESIMLPNLCPIKRCLKRARFVC